MLSKTDGHVPKKLDMTVIVWNSTLCETGRHECGGSENHCPSKIRIIKRFIQVASSEH